MANEMERDRYRGQMRGASNGRSFGGRHDEDDADDRRHMRYGDQDQRRGGRYGGSQGDYPQERRGDDWQRRPDQPPAYRSESGYYRDAGPEESGSWGGRSASRYSEERDFQRRQYGQTYGGQYAGVGQGQSEYGQSSDWYGGQQPYAGHPAAQGRQAHQSYQSEYGQSGSGQGPYRDSGYGEGATGRSLSGRSGYSDYGDHGRGDEIDDPDYQEWRRNQMKAFDDDYRSFRSERQKKFSNEFDEFRKNRPSASAAGTESGGSSSKGYGSKSTP